MASSAPSSPARHHAHRLADLQTRPPLLTARSIPSSPSSSSVAATLLSPRRQAPAAAAGAAMTPPTSFSPSPSPSPPVSFTPIRSPPVSAAPVAGTLRVEVISARNLHAAVLGSLLKWTANTSNPYVVITLHRDVFTTTTKDQTLNPTWKEMGQLPVPLPSEQELLQTVGMHRSIYDTGSGHSSDTAAKLATQKLMPKSLGSSSTGPGEFHPCFPHLHVQVFHRSADGEQDQGPGSPSRGRALDKLIGEVAVPILPCLMANTSSHRAWYTLLSDEHPDAGQIQLAMHYDVDNGLEPIKGDIVRLAGFGGMEYYAKLVNANARLDVVDVFQDQVLVQYKSLESWMLSFEAHRNLLFVVRRPSMLRDAQSQLQGQIVRVRHSPLVAKAHRVWQVIPASQRRQLHHLYDLAILSGGAVYTVMAKSVETTLHDGVQAGVKTCVNGSTEAVNQVSHEALRRFWWDSTSGQKHVLTRAEELARYLEGGPLGGRGKVVQAFGDLEEEKVDESDMAFTVDAEEEEDEEPESYESKSETLRDEDEEKTNDDDDENSDEDVPEQLLCPITGCLMIDPVVAADGHTYEREAIVQWFAGSNKSPMTGAQMETTQVFPNFTLKRMSQELQDQRRAAMRPL